MEESKRKTKTSTAVKSRYNQKAYDVISVRVPKDLAAAFREKCDAEGAVQAQINKYPWIYRRILRTSVVE